MFCFFKTDESLLFFDNPIYQEYVRSSTRLDQRNISLTLENGLHKVDPDVQYEKFRITLETRKVNFKVRGANPCPTGIISGHFCMCDDDSSNSNGILSCQNWKNWISNKIEEKLTKIYKPS